MPALLEEPDVPAVTPFRPRGHARIAWVVILACVGAIAVTQRERATAPDRGSVREAQSSMLLRMQARGIVGRVQYTPAGEEVNRELAPLNVGGPGQRLRYAVLVGEVLGPAKALEALEQIDKLPGMQLTPEQASLRAILVRLYTDYAAGRWDAPGVGAVERERLRADLGWYGDLALAPAKGPDPAAREAVLGPARITFFVTTAAVLGFLLLALAGGILLAAVVPALYRGRLSAYFTAGSPAGAIYAETFAVWLLLFVALQAGAGMLLTGEDRLALVGLAMLLSLAALAWPRLRGLSWRQIRQEVGLTAGPRPRREPLFGVGTYLMALPLLLLGVLLTLLLMRLQHGFESGALSHPEDGPSHPIVDVFVHLSGWGRLQVFLLASVLAPLVEEIMFRGVLYRHLREASNRWGRFGSALFSATVVSLLFALVHPQGVLAVPPLMALAFAFALAREWRGTLVPAMVAHGINNALVFTVLLLASL